MSQTSDTPKTDAIAIIAVDAKDQKHPCAELVLADFARQLERELATAKAQIEKLGKYAEHFPICPMDNPSANNPCTCGLSKLLEEIRA